MICCDSCGEWYHGECIGISVSEGKRMEKTGQDYICAKCVGEFYTYACTCISYMYMYTCMYIHVHVHAYTLCLFFL